MLTAIKDLGKRLPYPLLLRSYYAYAAATRDRRMESSRRNLGIPLLDGDTVKERKKSNVLFVLGSGSSINEIAANRWETIARHDSLGLNWWLIHPFVPTYYFLEAITREEHPQAFQGYLELANSRASDYGETLKVAMELHKRGAQTLAEFPPEFRRGLFAARGIGIPARNEDELRYAVRYLRSRDYFSRTEHYGRLLKYAASLTTMVVFALKAGYENVVFCGVDLHNPRYFFHDAELYPQWKDFLLPAPEESHHDTNVANPWRVPVTSALMILKQELLDPVGMKIFVESRSSALWPKIEEAPESLFA